MVAKDAKKKETEPVNRVAEGSKRVDVDPLKLAEILEGLNGASCGQSSEKEEPTETGNLFEEGDTEEALDWLNDME